MNKSIISEFFATFVCQKEQENLVLNSLMNHLKYLGKDLKNVYLDESINPNYSYQGKKIQSIQSLSKEEILSLNNSYIIFRLPENVEDYNKKFKVDNNVHQMDEHCQELQDQMKENNVVIFEEIKTEVFSRMTGSSINYYVIVDGEEKSLSSQIMKHEMYKNMLAHNVRMNVFVIFDKKRMLSIKYMMMDEVSSYYQEELDLLFVGKKFFFSTDINLNLDDAIEILEDDND